MNLKNSNCDDTQKIPIVIKLKNSNCDETQKLTLWWNSKNQILTKLQNSNWEKTQKLKWWQNKNYDKTHCEEKNLNNSSVTKPKLGQNSKTQIVTNSKTKIMTKLKNSNCDTNSKTQIVKKKTWIMTNLNLWEENLFSPNKLKN